ncbi:MAG: selenide, water dikinase SelD [Archangium sp.]
MVKLTQLSNCAGCAAKLRPDLLSELLAGIPSVKVKDALVGFETSDDAAVYKLSPSMAVVETVDFFPPVLDDPYAYGQIAAANAMSDIWAMGAKALFALNVVAFPKELDTKILKEILAGGASKAKEARIPILGGHSVQSPEPKYGMAVTGVVHPKKILRNSGGKTGDWVILTKPIGTGIATTALKRGLASKDLIDRVTKQMSELNKPAGEVFASGKFEVHALTDVTGFGLLGHGLELARGAKKKLLLNLESVPLLPEVPELAEQGVIPGGTKTNLAHAAKGTIFPRDLPEAIKHVLADAQTNGGLMAAVPEKHLKKAIDALARKGVHGWVVGQLVSGRVGIEVV